MPQDNPVTYPYRKIVMVDGKPHPCTVLAPGPEEHDETVWRERKRPSDAAFSYDGSMVDYANGRIDNNPF